MLSLGGVVILGWLRSSCLQFIFSRFIGYMWVAYDILVVHCLFLFLFPVCGCLHRCLNLVFAVGCCLLIIIVLFVVYDVVALYDVIIAYGICNRNIINPRIALELLL